ncbi:hypothetical protein M514_05786 [Trichuris suis]|uniref:DUF4371 domain-containing protein n=1 Tax=Trichuris suis TaxID=68888 RepID=A0A085NA96_9BILA|nr:hypothetical protein M514_05786 [Trichuris suis]
MSSLAKKKCRRYSVEYLAYSFVPSPRDQLLPMCLLCTCLFSNESMKPCKMKKHLLNAHPEYKDKDSFHKRGTRPQIIGQCSQQLDKGILASYKISKPIAQTGNAHNVGESLILPSVSIIISDVMGLNARDTVQAISLSNSVCRSIDEMAHDIEDQLVALLQSKKFSLQIDETTLQGNDALLMAYVRFWNANTLMEEMLFARKIMSDTKGLTIFGEIQNYFNENNIPFQNVIACASDGAASMVGRYRGFIAHLKRVLPSVFTIHCVIHREHLVSKKLGSRPNRSLSVVIHILGGSQKEIVFSVLLHYGKRLLRLCLRRNTKTNSLNFAALWKTIVAFMSEKEYEDKLIDAKADMFEKFNSLNKALQGRDNNLMNSKAAVVSFLKKLKVYWHNIGRHEFLQFPNLKTIAEEVNDDDLLVYVNHLKQIQKDMEERFHELVNLNIPDWIVDLFGVSAVEVDTEIQERLTFKVTQLRVANSIITEKIFGIVGKVQIFFIAFPSTYLVECGFSKVAALTKSRNRMDVATRGDMRLSLSNLEPDIMKLAKNCQPQGSH